MQLVIICIYRDLPRDCPGEVWGRSIASAAGGANEKGGSAAECVIHT